MMKSITVTTGCDGQEYAVRAVETKDKENLGAAETSTTWPTELLLSDGRRATLKPDGTYGVVAEDLVLTPQ